MSFPDGSEIPSDEEADYVDDAGHNFDAHYGEEAFKNGKLHLNITTSYQPAWSGKEAFREIWQNW